MSLCDALLQKKKKKSLFSNFAGCVSTKLRFEKNEVCWHKRFSIAETCRDIQTN